MQLVFVFAERLINMFLVNVFKIMTVIRTLRISTLMYNKVFSGRIKNVQVKAFEKSAYVI